VIGDRVSVSQGASSWAIETVHRRSTQFVRYGRAPKVIAANLDRVFAVVALAEPLASKEFVDRLLVLIDASRIDSVLVLNKLDLPGAEDVAAEYLQIYRGLGYQAYAVSARTSDGLEPLRDLLADGMSAVVGPSGVGKSSLLNALDPLFALRTGGLSAKTGTGRHTTVSSRLLGLASGGWVADTPGFGEVTLRGLPQGELPALFPEFAGSASRCRFRNCTHVREPDCGVRAAVDAGEIHGARYRSYVRIRAEAAGEDP